MKYGRKMGPYRSFKRGGDKNDEIKSISSKGLDKIEKTEPKNIQII